MPAALNFSMYDSMLSYTGVALCLFLLRCLVGFFVTFYKGFVGFLSCHGCAHAGCHTGSCKGGTGGIAR